MVRSIFFGLLVLLMTGCGTPRVVEFPYSDGAGLSEEETGLLTWNWRRIGVNVSLHIDQDLVYASGRYHPPPDLGSNMIAGSIRLLPGRHMIRFYSYRRTDIELEETFVVEAGHRYMIHTDVCWWANPRWGAAWIEDLETKKIVAGKATDCFF